MAHLLETRADLRRAFYLLTGTSAADSAIAEHDSEPGDTVNNWLQLGLWEAQYWIITHASPTRWIERWSVAKGDWEGSDQTGGKYVELPDDFIRLRATTDWSGLFRENGDRWGSLLPDDDDWRTRRGDFYWIENDRLRLTRLARPPNPVEVEYYQRHIRLTSDNSDDDGGVIDFPMQDRPLIVGLAAQEAADHPSFPGDTEKVAKISRYVKRWQERVRSRGRRTREPRKVKHQPALGSRFYSRG
ncbi:MAG: hypothetical protein ACOC9H_01095 [Gemmatimonadota bacterium]